MTADSNLDLLDNEPVFHLKGGMLTMTLIELVRQEPERFARQLAEKVEQAPNFFQDTPVVISLDKLGGQLDATTLAHLLRICRESGLQPVALRGAEHFRPLAQESGLVLMPPGRGREKTVEIEPAPQPAAPKREAEPQPVAENLPGRLITQPVRSGQQVYARGGDLVVLAPVSAGSELLADGNIHVYGPLRGRALAGVRGNSEARIFCQSLEAELVSIAGQYKVAEDLRRQQWKTAVQISLDRETLKIVPL
ncbi:septum site-determining protein MinC [Halopseudomonas xinjiangensis]|uniref:Probable septum site-determining protein MinC n=1 Tax=Halopseudomonas xinjiangensis TaxID=487184 RepID=A0A1H1U924_9GAMM|nr:septum site-determining protein MinC [Halopseudomonas xinjiangensis]SDS69002.1 septum site-determining protein MinC [Halopseudomonas xinjiangensis]